MKLLADTRVQAADDQVALLHARYEVRRAELEVTGNEFVGAIQAKKNLLALEEAKRGLAQTEADVQTHADSNRAGRAVLEEKRQKAQGAMQFAQRTIESMVVKAPIAGLVVVKENQDASGGMFFSGMSLPEYREGDTVQPGRGVAEIVDLSEIEIKAKVNEADRTVPRHRRIGQRQHRRRTRTAADADRPRASADSLRAISGTPGPSASSTRRSAWIARSRRCVRA